MSSPLYKIDSLVRKIILAELLVPIALLILGIYHGVLQVLYRAGIIQGDSFGGLNYYQGLTAHGVINAVVLTTFFAVAFGNAVICQFLKASISRFWTSVSFSLMVLGCVLASVMILSNQASVLYTFYPPLQAHPLFYIGLVLFVIGSWIAFFTWIPVYLKWRKENPGMKTPMPVLGMFATFTVWQIATIPVAVEILFLILPWSFGLTQGVNAVLARTLFWFFGHPLVYFWLLPTYVMYYSMLPKIAGGKLFSDFAGRFSFLMFIVLSSPLGLHHQFADPGISSDWKGVHTILTSIVAIPSMITAFTLAASLEIAARLRGGQGLFAWWKKLPYFSQEQWLFPYLFCGLVIFIFGGMTGLINSAYSMNNVIHNTAWVPAHFHLTVGGPVFLGILGMTLYMVSGFLGKPLVNKKLTLAVPYLWTLGVFIFSSGLFMGGLRGEPRRTNLGLTYLNPGSSSYRPDWWLSTHIGAIGGSVMGLAFVIYAYAFIKMLMQKPQQSQMENFAFPQSEAFHDEEIKAVQNLRPWVIASVVLVLIAYAPPIMQILSDKIPNAPGFKPDSPIQVESK